MFANFFIAYMDSYKTSQNVFSSQGKEKSTTPISKRGLLVYTQSDNPVLVLFLHHHNNIV